MESPKDKASLLHNLKTERAAWEALVAQVGEAHLTEPGVEGDWSVKDVIAHIAAYEEWTADQLRAVARGERGPYTSGAIPTTARGLDVDARNAVIFEARHGQSLAETLAQARATFDGLVAAIEALPEDTLSEPNRSGWTKEQPLLEPVAGNTYEHYHEHIPLLKAWLAQRAARA
jgi:hypothetical protein